MLKSKLRRVYPCGTVAGIVVATVILCGMAVGEELDAIELLHPDSLVGWDHGETPAGWSIRDGVLSGAKGSSRLLSGWTLGDFELRFRWTVSDDGMLEVQFPDVPSGEGWTMKLDRKACVLRTDDKTSSVAVPRFDGGHRVVIRRRGGEFNVEIDGKSLSQNPHGGVQRPGRLERSNGFGTCTKRRFGLALAVPQGTATIEAVRLTEPRGTALLNGRDLAGWWCPGNLEVWQVDDGVLAKRGNGGNYLRTEKEYENFVLSLEYRINKGGNSGIGIRTPRMGWPSGEGMELQILDRPGLDQGSMMAVYRNVAPVARGDRSGEWNHVIVRAEGFLISVWVNGRLVQHVNTRWHPELKHRCLKGWIGFQDHGGTPQFRNVYLRELPDGLGLKNWYADKPKGAAELVLNRLLNTEQLAVVDGVRSGTVTVDVTAADRQVLADLDGPGALVRMVGSSDGRLAFYFDGEDTPRIECQPDELSGKVPRLTVDDSPLLTVLAYAKSLRIVLRDAKEGRYRMEYVTFPENVAVESFVDTKQSIPRGWLAAIDYRHSHHRHGSHRDHDRYRRQGSNLTTIDPGERVPLVSIDGAGTVYWTKLRGARPLDAFDGLWLEVTIDGEDEPALQAPARFLFSAIQDGENYHNFVMLDRDGLTSRLAMPFGNGITLSGWNRGKRPLCGIGLTVCYEPAEEHGRKGLHGRMRLRGKFVAAGERSNPVALSGPGRLVGLVGAEHEGEAMAVDRLEIDGVRQPGWNNVSKDELLGISAVETVTRGCLSGRHGGLFWRFFFLAPVDFDKSLAVWFKGEDTSERLFLYYTGYRY